MSPPKFKDLHKDVDDAFKKSFLSGCFNTKVSTDYNMENLGTGGITSKINFDTASGAPSSEMEFKHVHGPYFGKFLKGSVVTKTITDKSSIMKVKFEKSCNDCNVKLTANSNVDLSTGMPKDFSLNLDHTHKNLTSQLNVTPEAGVFRGLDNVNANIVGAVGKVNLGVDATYGFAKGAINHTVKATTNQKGSSFHVGCTNANSLIFGSALKIDKNLDWKVVNFNVGNLYLKGSCAINGSNFAAEACVDYPSVDMCGVNFTKCKQSYNFITGDYAEVGSLKISKNLNLDMGYKTNVSDFFGSFKMGVAMNFDL